MSQEQPHPDQKLTTEESATSAPVQRWEYKVVHINININTNTTSVQPATPETDSQKLQGALSPEFIQREFPQMYQTKAHQKKHPAAQLENFLNLLGNEGWELIETNNVGGLLMFFFKRLASLKPDLKNG